MTKPEWGTKRTCQSCTTRYYDMKKKKPVCPKCETVFEFPSSPKKRRTKQIAEDEVKKKALPEDIDDIEVDAEGDEDSLIEDAAELEEDLDIETVVDIEKEDTMDDS